MKISVGDYSGSSVNQPMLPGASVTPANRIKLRRLSDSMHATRYGLAQDESKAVKQEYGDWKKKIPDFNIYHLHTLAGGDLLPKFLAYLETQKVNYEIL